jgi:hypothetical protein
VRTHPCWVMVDRAAFAGNPNSALTGQLWRCLAEHENEAGQVYLTAGAPFPGYVFSKYVVPEETK